MVHAVRSPVLAAILDATYNGIITIDRTGQITLFNAAAERLLGIPAREALGRSVQDVIPGTGLLTVLSTGEPQLGQQLTIGGRTIVSNRTPIWHEGQLVGAVAVFEDPSQLESLFSELVHARISLRQAEAVIESASDGIYITDGNGKTLRVNRAYEAITGLRAADLVDRNMHDLVRQGIFSESVTLLVLAQRVSCTIVQRIRGGREVLATGNPVFDEQGNIAMVVTSVRDITQLSALQRELYESKELSHRFAERLTDLSLSGVGELVAESPAMRELLRLAAQVAVYPTAILLQGESGVGKEVVSAFIHSRSPRAAGPFIRINCGAIPEQLLESELFGYEPGAFTGARKEGKLGLFELAHRGTILLDEVDTMPLNLQVKLLRVLQEQEVMRVGASRPRKVDVRVISSSNKDLESRVQEGGFRQDLFYRLNVVRLVVPPLRERPEDIPALARHFIEHYRSTYGLTKHLAPETEACLLRYPWPGNIRELKNLIEFLVVSLSGTTILPEDLPQRLREEAGRHPHPVSAPQSLPPLRQAVEELERQLVERAVREHKSLRQAARALDLDHATFLRKVKRYLGGSHAGDRLA